MTTNRPTIIVVGTTPRVSRALDELHPDVQVIEVHDGVSAAYQLDDYPDAVVAYGPETFPLFTSRQPQYVAAAREHAILFSNDPGTASSTDGVFSAMDNPEAFTWLAAALLGKMNPHIKLYDVTIPEAREALAELAGVRRG